MSAQLPVDTQRLAEFIVALGQFNGYGSTTAQTKEALDTGSTRPLRDDHDDRVIFTDILKAIRAVAGTPFSISSIIAINEQFDGDSREQPSRPGVLRHRTDGPIRNSVRIDLWPSAEGGSVAYVPPTNVDEWDLQDVVDEFDRSSRSDRDAWIMFARLAKLQPFQDGNKRTALLAVNHALGAFASGDFLAPPTGARYRRFTNQLLEFYGNGLDGSSFPAGERGEAEALAAFLDTAPARDESGALP